MRLAGNSVVTEKLELEIVDQTDVRTGLGFDRMRIVVLVCSLKKLQNPTLISPLPIVAGSAQADTWREGVSSGIEREPSALDGLSPIAGIGRPCGLPSGLDRV